MQRLLLVVVVIRRIWHDWLDVLQSLKGIVDLLTPMTKRPRVVVVENSGNAFKVHSMSAIKQLRAGLRNLGYVVSDHKVNMNQWDATNRCRYVCVAVLQEDVTRAGEFQWPQAVYSPSFWPTVGDILDDDSVAESSNPDCWLTEKANPKYHKLTLVADSGFRIPP